MRVLQVNSVCGYGSTGRIVVDLCNMLTRNGDEALAAYGRGTAPPEISSCRIGSDVNVALHGGLSRLTDRQGFYSRRATGDFLRAADLFQPDLVHLHNLHGYYLHLPTLFSWLAERKLPVVWTLHDCWTFTGHCAYFDDAGCSLWKTGCHDCPQKRQYPASLLLDRSALNYEEKKRLFTSLPNCTFVTPSQWLADTVKQSFLRDYPVCVIPNGVNLSVFMPREQNFRERYGLQGKRIALGVANIWEPRKGLPALMELAEKLDDTWAVVAVGLSEQQRRNLPPRMLGLGRTRSEEELAQIYSAADVFVNPTLEENFCLVNLEALACGTPVVTYPSGGSPEGLDDTCGLATKDKNVASLVSALESLPLRNWTRESCVARARQFDSKKQYQKYGMLYQQIQSGEEAQGWTAN